VNSRDRDVYNRKLSFGSRIKIDNEFIVRSSPMSTLVAFRIAGAISRVKEFTIAPPEGVNAERDGMHSARYF